MTYKLKDEELQRKLDELTDGGLTQALKNNNVLDLFYHSKIYIPISLKDGVNLQLEVARDAIDMSDWRTENHNRSYDPDVWNAYPKVLPPCDVPMRVEIYGEKGCRWKGFGIYKGDGVWDMDNSLCSGEDMLYRPWKERYSRR